MTKLCPRCQTDKPESDYRRNRSRYDGLDSMCRPCRVAYSGPWKRVDYARKCAAAGRKVIPLSVPTEERFWAKVVRSDGCWTWTGSILANGYAKFQLAGRRSIMAHRYSYELHKGPIPAGLEIDHLCRNRGCINPDHLEAVTPAENIRRSNAATGRAGPTKTHCKNGHPWVPENIKDRGRHGRTCLACLRAANQRHAAASGLPPETPA